MDLLQASESYTYDGLLNIITPWYTQALAQGQDIANNTSRISALFAAARTIADPAAKAARLAQLDPISRAQAQIVIDHRNFVNKWNAAINALNNWAAGQGIAAAGPPMLLSGLGVLPAIVPLSIIAAFIALGVIGFLVLEKSRTDAITRILNDPTLTAAQKAALLNSANKGSLEETIKALTMPLLLIAAIVIVPKVLPRRATA